MTTTERIDVGSGVHLAVDRWAGSGSPAFLLVHGLASNAQLWWGCAERLAELGHPCSTVDQRGHGRSDKPDAGYTMDQACADLVALTAALRQEDPSGWDGRVIVAGQSWGANVALELGYRHPEVFSGVVCVDGGTIELADRFPDWESVAEALAPPRRIIGMPRADMEGFMASAHPDWPESGRQAQMANFEVRSDGTITPFLSFEHHMELLRALWEHRPSTRYPAMKVPVLLVPADGGAGGRSPAMADKAAGVDAALAAVPRARAHWFRPADHDLHAQFPVELAELLHSEAADGILAP